MRLLHITPRYPPAIGGAERYMADLSEELARRGHQVDVFTTRALDFHSWKTALPPFEQVNGVNVLRFRSMQRRKWVWAVLHFGLRHYWRSRSPWYEPLVLFGSGPIAPAMFHAILTQARDYDLVHLGCLVYSHAMYGYWASHRLGVPIVITPMAHAEQEVTYNLGYQRRAMAGSDHVIAMTEGERDLLLSLGLDPWRVTVAGTGLRPEHYEDGLKWDKTDARIRLGLPAEGFVVLFLGRKSDYKGLDLALDAYAALRSLYPEMRFLAVGPETDYSQALWPRYQDLDGLHILEAISHEEKIAALKACDCLVLPSAGESFGIVFLEAWIMGKPVIGARTLSVASLIQDGHDGLLSECGDVADLAACIARLRGGPELAQRMGARGREKVLSHYTVPRIAERVEGIYLRVLRRRWREEEGFR